MLDLDLAKWYNCGYLKGCDNCGYLKGRDTGMLKISLAGANNSVPTAGLTPCIIIVTVYM